MGVMTSQITSFTIVYSSFIRARIKENIKVPRHWQFPSQRASNEEMFPFDDVIYRDYLIHSAITRLDESFANDIYQNLQARP